MAVLAGRAELEPVYGADGARRLLDRAVLAGDLGERRLDWLHEDFSIPEKDAVFAAARGDGVKIDAGGIVAASRLYTPDHIVAFLLQNSLGAMWLEMHPESGAGAGWRFLVRGALRPGRAPRPLRNLRVLDPCCGCGAFLTAAFDLLTDLYADERRLADAGVVDPSWTMPAAETAALIVGRNLAGADLDAEAVAIAGGLLAARAGGVAAQLTVPPLPVGSLAREVWPRERFDVVATNPPYVGFRMLDPAVKAAARTEDPLAASDLAVAFQSRCVSLLADGGVCATVTPAAWLSGREALPLRERMLADGGPRVTAALGQRVFDGAPLLFVGLSVVQRGGQPERISVLRPPAGSGAEGLAAAAAGGGVEVDRALVERLPLKPFLPAAPPAVLALAGRGPRLGDLFTSFDGVWTGSNARDTRFWWEVPGDPAWWPLSGGQGNEPWFAPTRLRIRREHAAGRPDRSGGIEYARVAGGRLAARAVDGDSAALAGVVTLMPRPGAEGRVAEALAIFNSRVGGAWLLTLSSGLNFNPGYAAQIPLGAEAPPPELAAAVAQLVALRRAAAERDPTCDAFVDTRPPWVVDPDAERQRALEVAVESLLARHLGLSDADLDAIPPVRRTARRVDVLADHLMVRALRVLGFRWPRDAADGATAVPAEIRADGPVATRQLAARVSALLEHEGAPDPDVDVRDWVERRFFAVHAARFRRRPVVEVLRSPTRFRIGRAGTGPGRVP